MNDSVKARVLEIKQALIILTINEEPVNLKLIGDINNMSNDEVILIF